jgi:hypothetical protein
MFEIKQGAALVTLLARHVLHTGHRTCVTQGGHTYEHDLCIPDLPHTEVLVVAAKLCILVPEAADHTMRRCAADWHFANWSG